MKDKVKHLLKRTLIFTPIAAAMGALIGAVMAGFSYVLKGVDLLRESNIYLFIPCLAIGGLAIVFFFKKFGKNLEKGADLLKDVYDGKENEITPAAVPVLAGSTWITHLFGGSSGKEGVGVQIGAAIAHNIGKRLPYADAGRLLMVAGMAAGFGGLFGTPLAAFCFCLEILRVKTARPDLIVPSLAAAFSGSWIAGLLGNKKLDFGVIDLPGMNQEMLVRIIAVALLASVIGMLFKYALHGGKKLMAKILPNPYIRIAVFGVIISALMLLTKGYYSGSGGNIINGVFFDKTFNWYDWMIKIGLTLLTLAVGYKGGEVVPLFAIGTAFGAAFAGVAGVPVLLGAMIGFAAFLSGGTGAHITAFFVGVEIFGFDKWQIFLITAIVGIIVWVDLKAIKKRLIKTKNKRK